MSIPAFVITELDGSLWVTMGIWFGIWAVLVITGYVLTQREKQRGGPPIPPSSHGQHH